MSTPTRRAETPTTEARSSADKTATEDRASVLGDSKEHRHTDDRGSVLGGQEQRPASATDVHGNLDVMLADLIEQLRISTVFFVGLRLWDCADELRRAMESMTVTRHNIRRITEGHRISQDKLSAIADAARATP